MVTIPPHLIEKIYRDVLAESLTFATANAQHDSAAANAITTAFKAIIPQAVPPHLVQHVGDPNLRDILRSDAARQLLAICEGMPLPRGSFVANVAAAAQRKV